MRKKERKKNAGDYTPNENRTHAVTRTWWP